MPRCRPTLLALVVCLGLLARATAQAPDANAPAPPLRRGTLPNGLHYVVLPHASPKGDIGLRLVVHAGSLDEHDDERGFAHFIEHMAFQGTRTFPAGSIRYFFQGLGLAFGADLNASTGYTHTTYLLDLPREKADQLTNALLVFRDYADGLLFEPEAVARESRVVISELHARDSAARRNSVLLLQALYAGTPLPDRDPAGDETLLARATAEQLRAFYQRNYAPDRMTVVVSGPVDPAEAVEKISAVFAPIAAPASLTPAAPAPEPPAVKGVRPDVVVLPTAKGTAIELIANTPRPPDSIEGHRHELVQRMANAALARRLRERCERKDITLFVGSHASYEASPVAPLLVQHALGLSCAPSSWSDAVEILETELRRATTSGFTQAEIDEAVAGQLTALRNRVSTFAGEPATRVVEELVRFVANDRTWQTPETDVAEATRALQGLTAAEVNAALPEIFPSDSLHLILTVAPDHEIKPDRLLAAYTKSAARPLKKVTAVAEDLHFRYDNFGAPGAVAKREHLDDLDLTLVSFANGVQLNVRPTDFEPERFRLRIVFPLNLAHVPADRGGIAELAGQLLLHSNLRRHKETELTRLIKLHGISPQFGVNQGTPALTIGGPSTELPFALQFVTALLSDLDLDVDHYRIALSYYGGKQHSLTLSPGPYALMDALYLYTGRDSRVWMLPAQSFGNENSFDETSAWLRDHVLNGPLEIGLVGDLAPDAAIDAAAATVATLRRRRPEPGFGSPLASPTKPTRSADKADIPASTTMSCVLWPVTLPDDPAHNAALSLATDILRDRMLLALREVLGATYSPEAHLHRDFLQRDFAFVALVNTFDPPRAQQFTEGSIRYAALLAQKGATPAEFERLREPARAHHSADLRNNGWWLDVAATAQTRPAVLEEARRHEKIYDEITLEDVNAAAQTFNPARVTAVILSPDTPGKPAKK
ncbi:MAG TPA: insulinase family protein [Opitutaceae bacterium]|nr:insulinase family protein [Opitutaceae bacterium]